MAKSLLLFDIDGTLLKTGGMGMQAMYTVAERLFGPGFVWDGIVPSGHLDPLIFAEAAALNKLSDHEAHHDRFRDHYLEQLETFLTEHRHKVETMPGVHEMLGMLRKRLAEKGDVVLGMLTGNYSKAVPIKLKAIGVDPAWFTITAFGDEASSRPGLVEVALRKYKAAYGHDAERDRVIVIGDTPRDVQCAKAHDCRCLAVSTGEYSVDELLAAGADLAVSDLSDPSPLLALLDR